MRSRYLNKINVFSILNLQKDFTHICKVYISILAISFHI